MTEIKQEQLEAWELALQDAKTELSFANEHDEDFAHCITSCLTILEALEREIWEKKIEVVVIIKEKKKGIKVNDYKSNKTYYI